MDYKAVQIIESQAAEREQDDRKNPHRKAASNSL